MNSLRLQRLYGSKRPLVLVAVGFLVSIFIFYGRDTALKIVPLQVLRPNSPVTEPAEVPVEPTKSPVQPIKDPVEPTESLNESTKPVEQPTPTSILTPPVPTAYVGGQQNRGPQRVVNPFDDGDSLYRACLGPKNEEVSRQDGDTIISGFSWDPSGFAAPILGSYEAWGLNRTMCTNRVSRYSPYGYVDAMAHNRTDDTVGSKSASHVQWEKVNWASLQRDCLQRNGPRFHTIEPREKKIWTLDKRLDRPDESKTEETNPKALPRTAVILRSWLNMKYKENDLHHIRAMIMEMSLASGGEYEVVLLVDCHDEKLPDPHNQAAIDQFKEQHLPQELREIAVFFNKKMLRSWYPDIDEHEAIVQYYQPTQIYSRLHPQYDYIWQFEMDSRYTGHYYSLVHQATEFAKQQPRKHLWERNSYFYMPAVHGSWENFTEKVDRDMVGLKSVWGAVPTESILVEGEAPIPPVRTPAEDHYEWGVGEEADLITWLPHFDPTDTDWPFKDKVYNFPEGRNIPRRSAVVAMSRVSKKLLRVMHDDKVRGGYGLASEMSCVSWALFYGLKAVQIPLPVYHEHDWDPQELNRRANAGKPGRINAEMDSLWSWELNDDIIFGSNFNFNSDFSGKLFRAWMGLDSAAEWEEENPRLCFPPILFHPVKDLSPN